MIDIYAAGNKLSIRGWRIPIIQAIHDDRKFLGTLNFTDTQLHRYDNVVCGINTRLQAVLVRNRT